MSVLNNMQQETHDESLLNASSSVFVTSVIIAYLIFVYQLGPRYMKNRPAFQLKIFMSFYNIIQVAACLYIINRIWNLTSWRLFDFTTCVDYVPNTPKRRDFDDVIYKIFFLKVFELTDTVIFVLRKKQNQITYLHVFHHASTITLVYFIALNYKRIAALYPIYLNSWVHVIMYSYYFFANICSADVMKKYIWVKKSITVIQMIQFCFILFQAFVLWSHCQIPLILKTYYCVVVSVIFYGFYDFYKKTYTKSLK